MSAGHGDKDADGKTIRTHAGNGFATPNKGPDTSGPSMNRNSGPYMRPLNRAERRALARKKR